MAPVTAKEKMLLAVGVVALVLYLLSLRTQDETEAAVSGNDDPASSGLGKGQIQLRLTTYYPLDKAGSTVEGGSNDYKGRPLQYVEDFLAGSCDWVSLSGDPNAWPDGQHIDIPWGDRTIFGRVVDTGSNFSDLGQIGKIFYQKIYRVAGYEPIDVAVRSHLTTPPANKVTAQIVVGDNWGPSKQYSTGGGATEVNPDYIKGQDVQLSALDGYSTDDGENA
jgi:hypothetical protein